MSDDVIYIVRYALSDCIRRAAVRERKGARVYIIGNSWNGFTIGQDCADTEQEAREIAEKMRVKKLASLRKSIDKLEKKVFAVKARDT